MILSSQHVKSLRQFHTESSLFCIRYWLQIFHIPENKLISVKHSVGTVKMSSNSSKKSRPGTDRKAKSKGKFLFLNGRRSGYWERNDVIAWWLETKDWTGLDWRRMDWTTNISGLVKRGLIKTPNLWKEDLKKDTSNMRTSKMEELQSVDKWKLRVS